MLTKLRTKIILSATILLGAGLIGSLLLFAVYCIPTEKIIQNVSSGSETFLIEGATFDYAPGYKSSILDNVTDAIMLSETVFSPCQNPFHDAMAVPRYVYENRATPELSLMAFLYNDTETERHIATYPRYWHGYLIFLKPFFYFFDYSDSRIFHLGMQGHLLVSSRICAADCPTCTLVAFPVSLSP